MLSSIQVLVPLLCCRRANRAPLSRHCIQDRGDSLFRYRCGDHDIWVSLLGSSCWSGCVVGRLCREHALVQGFYESKEVEISYTKTFTRETKRTKLEVRELDVGGFVSDRPWHCLGCERVWPYRLAPPNTSCFIITQTRIPRLQGPAHCGPIL